MATTRAEDTVAEEAATEEDGARNDRRERVASESVALFVTLAAQVAQRESTAHAPLRHVVFDILFAELHALEAGVVAPGASASPARRGWSWRNAMWQRTAERLLSLLDVARLSPGARDCLATAPWVSLVLRYALVAAPLALQARRCCVRLLRALLPRLPAVLIDGLSFPNESGAGTLRDSVYPSATFAAAAGRGGGSSSAGSNSSSNDGSGGIVGGRSLIEHLLRSIGDAVDVSRPHDGDRAVFAAECVALVRALLAAPTWDRCVVSITGTLRANPAHHLTCPPSHLHGQRRRRLPRALHRRLAGGGGCDARAHRAAGGVRAARGFRAPRHGCGGTRCGGGSGARSGERKRIRRRDGGGECGECRK